MSYQAKILADSTAYGTRLVTFELTFPRILLAEVNTHRMFSRNSASSRAIPVSRRIDQIRSSPFVPESFGKNKSGMQAPEQLDDREQERAREEWEAAAWFACQKAQLLSELGAHKQHANRVIEPYAWHTAVVSSTEWPNWEGLRDNEGAQPEIQILAQVMKKAKAESTPRELEPHEWHLPYIDGETWLDTGTAPSYADLVKISVARCAAVSYERQNAVKTLEEYIALCERLSSSGHWSCFEHQAKVVPPLMGDALGAHYNSPFGPTYVCVAEDTYELDGYFAGNLRAPFLQYRKQIPGENVFRGTK